MRKLARWWSLATLSILICPAQGRALGSTEQARAEQRESWLEALEPPLLDAPLEYEAAPAATPCGSASALKLAPLSWAPLSFSAAPSAVLPPGAGVTSTFASLRVTELEEQRRTRLLDKLQLKGPAGSGANILTGDVAGVASVAAEALSLNLNLGRRRPNTLSFDDSDPSRPSWSFGLGLGRLGLKLRSEW